MTMLLEYRNDDIGAKVIIDDDGKTCYAYLLINEEIVSDVWLYNVGEPPQNPEWLDQNKMPFTNPAGFASTETFEPISDLSEISLDWNSDSSQLRQLDIFLRGKKHAVLRPNAKPGWCRLASKGSPVARPLHEAD